MNILRCKVALIGDPRVGKTSIVNQLIKNSFNNTYQTTLGIDYNQYETKIENTNYTVQFHIMDFTGFSIYREIIGQCLSDVNYIIYVYDSTNLETFQNIQIWKMGINEMPVSKKREEYLVGNKTETVEKIAADKTSIENLAKKLNLKPFNVSARANKGIKELFEDIASNFYEKYFSFTQKVKSL